MNKRNVLGWVLIAVWTTFVLMWMGDAVGFVFCFTHVWTWVDAIVWTAILGVIPFTAGLLVKAS